MNNTTEQLMAAEFAGAAVVQAQPRQRERKRIAHVALNLNQPIKLSMRGVEDILLARVLTGAPGATITYYEYEGVVQRTYEFCAVPVPTDWLSDLAWTVIKVEPSPSTRGYAAILYRDIALQSGQVLSEPSHEGDAQLQRIRQSLFNRDSGAAQAPVGDPATQQNVYTQQPVGTITQKKPGLIGALDATAAHPMALSAAERSQLAEATGIKI